MVARLLLITLALMTAPVWATSPSEASQGQPTPSFVQRAGGQLSLDGRPFRFSGPNIHWLGLYKGGSAYPTPFEIDDVLATAQEMGATVVRSHTLGISTGCAMCIEPSLNTFNDAAFQAIDYAVKSAADHGLKLIIPLTDNWHYYYGGKHNFTDWRGVPEDSFFTDPVVIEDFKQYIAHILNHVNPHTGLALKDDPTIMAWETGNELNTSTYRWTESEIAWTKSIADYIKSLDPNHLVMDGHHSSPRTTNLLAAALSIPSVDMYSSHLYPLDSAFTEANAALAAKQDKVYIVGEYDWTERNGGDTLADFAEVVEEPANHVAGDLYWVLYGHAEPHGFVLGGGNYFLRYPGDAADAQQRAQLLRTHAYRMRDVTVPAHRRPDAPLLYPLSGTDGNVRIAWRGVVAAASYTIERSSDGGDTWRVVKTGLSDTNAPWYDPTGKLSDRYRIQAVNLAGVGSCYTTGCPSTPPEALSLGLAEVGPDDPDQHVAGTTLFYNPSPGRAGSFVVTADVPDPETDIAEVAFPTVFEGDGVTDDAAPFEQTYSWGAGATATGTEAVTTTNRAGLTASSSFAVRPDTAVPTVAVKSPKAGARLEGGKTITVSVAASDADAGVAQVEVRVCKGTRCAWGTARPIGVDRTAPYRLRWRVPRRGGRYTFLARATDRVGNVGGPGTTQVTSTMVEGLAATEPGPAERAPAGAASEPVPTADPTVALEDAANPDPSRPGRAAAAKERGGDGAMAEGPFAIAASGGSAASGDATRAHDGKTKTAWTTETPTRRAFLWLDLGQKRRVGAVRWLQVKEGGAVEIQVSTDHKRWTPVGRGRDVRRGGWQTLEVDAPARYVRFLYVATDGEARLGHLAEVAVYGRATTAGEESMP